MPTFKLRYVNYRKYHRLIYGLSIEFYINKSHFIINVVLMMEKFKATSLFLYEIKKGREK